MNKVLAYIILLRPKQWVKNSFVIAPLIFSGLFVYEESVYQVLLATILFCIASSATYILNDIKDVENDRKHPVKLKKRPLASGAANINTAIVMMVGLYTILVYHWFIVPDVINIIVLYLLMNFAYTFFFKEQPVFDIFIIAIGFVLRVYVGAVALNISLSSWMFITTLCLALYLASMKRRQEMVNIGKNSRKVLHLYSKDLIEKYALISASGSFIFYSLFAVQIRPELMITIPFVLFGIFRYWFIVERLNSGESPTDALFEDKIFLATIITWLIVSLWVLGQ